MNTKIVKTFITVACLPVLMISCTFTQKLPKRYKSLVTRNYPATKDSIKYFVGVSGYVYTVPARAKKQNEETAKNVFSLSGEGQKQLIESIADNEESTEEIYNKLALDIIPARHPQPVATGIARKMSRRIVLAVDDMHMTAADKVQKLTIMLVPQATGNIKILSCNKLTNSYHKVTGKKDDIAMQPPALSSVVTPEGGLIITVDNFDGNILTGNIAADVTVEYTARMNTEEVFTCSGLWSRDGSAVKPVNIVLHHHRHQIASAGVAGGFGLEYEATVKHVARGDNTISEGDDVIEIIKGKTQNGTMNLVKDAEMKLKRWSISDGTKHLYLSGSLYNGKLEFDSYQEAQDFIAWFKRSSADILANNRISNGDYKVGLSGESGVLTDSFIESCQVMSSEK